MGLENLCPIVAWVEAADASLEQRNVHYLITNFALG